MYINEISTVKVAFQIARTSIPIVQRARAVNGKEQEEATDILCLYPCVSVCVYRSAYRCGNTCV